MHCVRSSSRAFKVYHRFVEYCERAIATRFGDSSEALAANKGPAKIISTRPGALIDDELERGAKPLVGGDYGEAQRYVLPTLLGDVPPNARVLNEEIFGPLLPMVTFDEIDKAISWINTRPKPLALYIWSSNNDHAARILSNTRPGGVCINHCLQHYAHGGLPFGGIGQSGIDNAHGFFGFRALSHERAILRGGRLLIAKALFLLMLRQAQADTQADQLPCQSLDEQALTAEDREPLPPA